MKEKLKQLSKRLSKFEWFLVLAVLVPYTVNALYTRGTVIDWFTTDDAFYYFQVARNIASGNGITFDGLNRTNGFHPLWMAVCTPVFALAGVDKMLPLRIIVLLLGLLYAGSSVLIYRLTKRILTEQIASLAAVVWAFSIYLHRAISIGGMESGINAFFLLLLLERVSAINDRESLEAKDLKEIVWVGVIATLTILSRLDNVFAVLFVGAWFWVRWWNPSVKGTRAENWKWRLQIGFAFYTPVVAIMLLYLGFNQVYFGTWMPVSGQVKVWWGEMVWTVYGRPVETRADFYEAFISPNRNTGPWSVIMAPLHQLLDPLWKSWGQGVGPFQGSPFRMWGLFGGLAGLALGALAWPNRKEMLRKVIRLGLIPLTAAALLQISYYKISGSVAERYWYWIIEDIIMVLSLGILVDIVYLLLKRWLPKSFMTRFARGLVAVVGVVMAFRYGLYMADKLRPLEYYDNHVYIRMPSWLEANTEPGAWIAMTGSGSTGYFIEGRTVLNIDGLSNSYQFFQMMKEGRGAEFMEAMGLDYVFGKEYIVTSSRPYEKVFEGRLEEVGAFTETNTQNLLWRFTP